MNFKEQLYIKTLAEKKSISKAARELNISQPALSKYLSNLEQNLDCPLFDKENNNYVPTFFGKKYLHYAEAMLELNDKWEQEAEDILQHKSCELTIAIPIMRSTSLLPSIIPNFIQKYPSVKINLLEETHNLNVDSFDEMKFDFAIYNASKFLDNYYYESLVVEDIVIVASKDNEVLNKYERGEVKEINLSLFKDYNFILYPEDLSTGKKMHQRFRELNIDPKLKVVTRNTELAISCASRGEGIALAPLSYVLNFKDKYPIKYAKTGNKTELFCVYKNGKFISEYARFFIDSIKAYYN